MTSKNDNLNQLAKAANHIRMAIEALDKVTEGTGKYDAAGYSRELSEILSADRSETGLENLIKLVEKSN